MSSISKTFSPIIYVTCEIQLGPATASVQLRSDFECFLFQLPFFLESIGIGYICIATNLIIVIVTIFGKIKESYKWFILNQALWDLLLSYDFTCAQPSSGVLSNNIKGNCIYSYPSITIYLTPIIDDEAGYMLFLLATSRFFALFYRKFYEEHFTHLKAGLIAGIYDIFFIFLVNLRNIYILIRGRADTASDFLKFFEYILLLILILTSFVLINLILATIFRRLKNQLQQQQNRANTISSLRISTVLIFHCFTLCILLAFTSVYDFHDSVIPNFNYYFLNQPMRITLPPKWIQGLKNNQKSFNIFRVLIDSFAILIVLTEYRRNLFGILRRLVPCWKTKSNEISGISRLTITNASNTRHK